MVTLARQEWGQFGHPVVQEDAAGRASLAFAPGVAPTHELQEPMLTRVLLYWYAVSRHPIIGPDGELRPWSAAFIAWLAAGAGYTPQEFPRTVLHWDYIERFLANGPDPTSGFVAHDPQLHAPHVGDLVCNARNDARRPDFTAQAESFATLQRGPYHCDLVVALRADHIEVIGGNVADTVSMTRLAIGPDGRLAPDSKRRWVTVIEHAAPAPLPGAAEARTR